MNHSKLWHAANQPNYDHPTRPQMLLDVAVFCACIAMIFLILLIIQ